ncbi:MAG TPA: S8 family serine peptidase, partial [Saprospiraceae bacterium]|nr:S8 family serine peptidase [Saprospiraceae bacterium]
MGTKFLYCWRYLIFITVMIEYTNSNAQNYEYVPGEIIVQTRNFQSLDNLKNKLNKVESRAQTTKNSSIDIQEIQSSVLPLLHIKTDESNIISLIRELKDYKEVIFVQRNKVLQKRNTPNDPDFIRQWTLLNPVEKNDSRVPKAWDITTGGVTALGDTIVVAIIDDGVGRHDDLVGNLWINHKEIPGDGIDNDGNGFIDDYYGWNSQNNNDLIFTDERHGTAIAGIVGAKG